MNNLSHLSFGSVGANIRFFSWIYLNWNNDTNEYSYKKNEMNSYQKNNTNEYLNIFASKKWYEYDTNKYSYRKIFEYPNIRHTLICAIRHLRRNLSPICSFAFCLRRRIPNLYQNAIPPSCHFCWRAVFWENSTEPEHWQLADCPTMSFVFVCWHSRKWSPWPPIRLGTLQLAVLRLEKVNWTDFFCKNGISYTNCQWKSKELDKKRAKTLQKRWFFQPLRSAGWVYPK